MIIAITGPPGSGKTTVAERVAKARGFEFIYGGAMFREMAKDYAMSLADFSRYAQDHHNIDKDLDERIVARVKERSAAGADVVVDGRLQAWLLPKRGVRCFRVLIDASLRVRAERVAGREGKTVKQAKREVQERERSERARYSKIYGIDVRDASGFDLVVDSSDKTPDQVVAVLEERVSAWAN